jgi:hypothetical protein
MPAYDLLARRARYSKLSSAIAHIDTAQVQALFDASEAQHGWGRNHILDIAGEKVFIKRLPVTELEYANAFSTRNHYDLPTYYNYGVGSAGFGMFRELVAHIKTTNWVLEGSIAQFPLLYHYRLMPFYGARADIDIEQHKRYVEYWNGNEQIGQYRLDRANAPYELVLFLEYFPHKIETWLSEHLDKLDGFLDDMRAAITFLRMHGIVHFDVNLDNIVSDGEQAYLTDFGLVLDKQFALTEEEQAFFEHNSHYDYGELLWCLDFLLYRLYDALSDAEKGVVNERYGIKESTPFGEKLALLLDNIEELHTIGMTFHEHYLATVVRYRSIVALFSEFFFSMRNNQKKDTRFPNAELIQLLDKTGFLQPKPDRG